jgi:hypothetical protein
VGDLTLWSKGADTLATELHHDIQDLKSRMKQLESISSAPLHKALPREEEGRAKATALNRATRVPMVGLLTLIPPWSRVRLVSHNRFTTLMFQSLVTGRFTMVLSRMWSM